MDIDEWLRRAKSSLIYSKMNKVEDLYYEELCFSCQQSAEKSLKALILSQGLKLHKTHSFRKLLDELEKRITIPDFLPNVLKLEIYAVTTRYPDDYYEITEEEYNGAVEIAEQVYNWVVKTIK